MKLRTKVVACVSLLAATATAALLADVDDAVSATGVPSAAQCDEDTRSCYVGVGGYVLRVSTSQGEVGSMLLAEAEEARREGRVRSYRGHPEVGPDGHVVVRRGRLVVVDPRW